MATNQDYYLQILTACRMKLKLRIFKTILVRIKKFLILVIIWLSHNIMTKNELVIGNMRDELRSIATKEFVGLKPKVCLILISDSSEYKKAKGVMKYAVAKLSHNEYKDILLNKNVPDI